VPLFSFFNPSIPQEEFFSAAFLTQLASHLGPALPPFFVAAAACAVLTPVSIFAARRLGVIAHPEPERRIHAQPTPLLGGSALYVAFAATVLWAVRPDAQVVGLLAVCGLATAIFILDDRFRLPALAKIGVEAALSLLAMAAFGFVIGFLTLPGFGIVQLGLIGLPLTLFWLLGMQNTVNLLDGVDGLAAGVVAIVALVLMVAAASRGQQSVVLIAAALAGACGGFLLFNFHPASIFMGDSGSHFLGMALGLLSILGVAKIAVVFALVVPVVALAVPIADTAIAIIRRRRRGLSIAHADTGHIHHQLLTFGLTQPQTCLVIYGATGILGALGLMLFGHRRILSVAIVVLVVLISTVAGEQLQRAAWRLPSFGLKRVLADRSVR
jgi:UDP-GlcNAc:undecaprenyl-phosphate GlcNAc-1-phosphate transferase